MKTYVLDACAVIALFKDEKGAHDDVFRQAAKFKTSYKLSLADSIVLAQAVIDDAIVVTSDHHELNAVELDGCIKFLWIR